MSYADFLARKRRPAQLLGRPCEPDRVHPMLHGWQREIVAWAVRTGRAAVWADTGLGKTFMQLEWARLSGGQSLIVAPLAVCRQTVEEAAKLGIPARYVREDNPRDRDGVRVTNYELVDKFEPAGIHALVLDESSILKHRDSKTRTKLITHFRPVARRLSCSATPAPNDPQELTNQAEFLGVTTRPEMLASYFVHDSDGWRLKGHARGPMFRWMAGWAAALRRPSDLGYPDDGYDLPPLRILPELVEFGGAVKADGELFAIPGQVALGGVGGRAKVRKATLSARVDRAVELVKSEPDEPWLLWTGLNDEARALAAAIPGAVNVEGNWSPEAKADALLGFARGDIQVMVTKPSIAAQGLNWQRCARMAFVGLSDSWEQYYQAIRRCWRYGQTREVHAHIVLSDVESAIADNVARKENEARAWTGELVAAMRDTWKENAA